MPNPARGFPAALLMSALWLLPGCASQQSVDELGDLVAAYTQAIEKNRSDQSETREELQQLTEAGQVKSERAIDLRKYLDELEQEQLKQDQVLADFQATIQANRTDIEVIKSKESSRSDAIDKLNQSFDSIDTETSRKIKEIDSTQPSPEGE